MTTNSVRTAIAVRRYLDTHLNTEPFDSGKLTYGQMASTVHALLQLAEHGIPISGTAVVDGALVIRGVMNIDLDLSINGDYLMMVKSDLRLVVRELRIASRIHGNLTYDKEVFKDFVVDDGEALSFKDFDFAVIEDPRRALTDLADTLSRVIFRNETVEDVHKFLSVIDVKAEQELEIHLNGSTYAIVRKGELPVLKDVPEAFDYIKLSAVLFNSSQGICKLNFVIDEEDGCLAIEPL